MCESACLMLVRVVKATAELLYYWPPALICGEKFECEHTCWDPKDGELCLNRVKPGETLVEARSDTDVQIVRHT